MAAKFETILANKLKEKFSLLKNFTQILGIGNL